jgi:oligopeptidase A
MVVTAEEQLKGLPPSAIAMARASAESKGVEGWRFTLQGPSYVSVMTYLTIPPARAGLAGYNTRARRSARQPRFDGSDSELRKEKAKLLGFKDFSDLVLDDRMAHTGERAQNFLKDLREKTDQRFREENKELEAFAGRKLEPWDIGYWAEKQRAALYDFDEEELRPYFPLERVVSGMFEIFSQILGIRVSETKDMPVWEQDVKTYEFATPPAAHLGSFYADWYPRENKRGGAWMDSLITGDPAKSKRTWG